MARISLSIRLRNISTETAIPSAAFLHIVESLNLTRINIPVIVDFYSYSCVACKMLAQQYGIMSNPTLILFKDGEAVDRKVGAQTADVLKAWVEENI